MSAPLYSRYVPPKKKSRSIIESPKSPEPELSRTIATPPTSLYARYVPPKAKAQITPQPQWAEPTGPIDSSDAHSKSKKRKRSDARVEEESGGKQPKKKEKTKHKSRKLKVVEETEDIDQDNTPAITVRNTIHRNQGEEVKDQEAEQELNILDAVSKGEDSPNVDSILAKYSVTGGARRTSTLETQTEDVDSSDSASDRIDRRSDYSMDDDSPDSEFEDANAGAEAIFAKYRKSVQITEAVQDKKSKKTKEGPKEASPEPELHGLEPLPQPAPTPIEVYKPTFESLPSWIAEPRVVTSKDTVRFEDLGLSKRIHDNLIRKEYTDAMAVQCAVLPLLLSGPDKYHGDICVSAPTGSGKTLAYVLPLVDGLQHKNVTRLRGLIVVPTRELVVQAREVAEICAAGTGVKIGTAVGNVSLSVEQAALVTKGQKFDPDAAKKMHEEATTRIRLGYDEDDTILEDVTGMLPSHVPEYNSAVDILICTPGRLVDHIRSTTGFTLEYVDWLVIDEVDRLLDQSFQEWVNVLLPALYPVRPYDEISALEKVLMSVKGRHEQRFVQKVVLSATMTRDLGQLASLKLSRPTLVAVIDEVQSKLPSNEAGNTEIGGFELPLSLNETAIPVADGSDKPLYLVQLLQDEFSIFDGSIPASKEMPAKNEISSTNSGSDSSSDSSSDTGSDDSVESSESDRRSDDDDESENEKLIKPKVSISDATITHGTSKPFRRDNVLIFTNSNDNASRLRHLLLTLFPQHAALIVTLTKSSATSAGRKVLNAFRDGRAKVLIASDRASRGLDVPDLANVINYDMPSSVRSYVHRVGRTARAGKGGKAWTLYTDSEARWFWKSIAQGEEIRRGDRVVKRMRIDARKLDEDKRSRYHRALEELQSAVQGTG